MHQQKIQKLKTKTLGIAIFALAFFSVQLAGSSLPLHSAAAAEVQPSATAITIDDFSYALVQLETAPGTPVTWIQKDDAPHTVVSVEHKFKSRALDADESFSFTFQDPGTKEYFCSVHPRMTGKILVK
jgi:plastocyanin